MFTKTQWQDAFKFFSGAFFIAALLSIYVYIFYVIKGPDSFGMDQHTAGLRSIIYSTIFSIFFYLGFLRKTKSSSIS